MSFASENYPHYVKCKYSPGMFSDEYSIGLNAEEEGFWVDKEFVKVLDNENALLRALVLELTDDKALIRICHADGMRSLWIPRGDVFSESELELNVA